MKSQIENNFKYHTPKEGQIERYNRLYQQAKRTAELVDKLCPNSREKSLAITKLEESVMWANASMARNEDNNELTISEVKHEAIFGTSIYASMGKLDKIMDYELNKDEYLIRVGRSKKWLKTNERMIKILNPDSDTLLGMRFSKVYVDGGLPVETVNKIVKPLLIPTNGSIEYF